MALKFLLVFVILFFGIKEAFEISASIRIFGWDAFDIMKVIAIIGAFISCGWLIWEKL